MKARTWIAAGLVLSFPPMAVAQPASTAPDRLKRITCGTDIGESPQAHGLTGANKLRDPFIVRLRISLPEDAPSFTRGPLTREGEVYRPYVIDPLADGGWFAMVRVNPGETLAPVNRGYIAILWGADGTVAWELPLTPFLERDDTEIQDVRFDGATVYFNEACQSYSSGSDGKCSSLVAVDAAKRAVKWRTPYLISNDIFILASPKTIVAGYGFTNEKDYLHLVDAETGEVTSRTRILSGHDYLEIKDGQLWMFNGRRYCTYEAPE